MNKHFVIHPDGTKSTRNSQNHTYSFAIEIGPERREAVIARNERTIARYEAEKAKYEAVLAYLNNNGDISVRESYWTAGEFTFHMTNIKTDGSYNDRQFGRLILTPNGLAAEDIEEARAIAINSYKNYAASCDHSIRHHQRLIAKLQAGPELVGRWAIATWCGRKDLAQKQLNKWSNYNGEVRIVETERAA